MVTMPWHVARVAMVTMPWHVARVAVRTGSTYRYASVFRCAAQLKALGGHALVHLGWRYSTKGAAVYDGDV